MINKKTRPGVGRVILLWSIADSNRLPQHCQCCALPDELIPLISFANLRNENEFPTLIGRFFAFFMNFVEKYDAE